MAPTYNLNHVTSHPFMTCILRVNKQHYFSRRTIAKVLEKCNGVHSFRMDNSGLVEISGTANPRSLLKTLGRAGRSAELCWFQFGECSSNLFMPVGSDGRYLQAGSLSRPTPPSQNTNQDNGYYGYGNNHDHQYHSGYGHGGYWSSRGDEDIGCCRVM